MKKKSASPSQKMDKSLLILILFILTFGVVMIYDATVVYSHDVFGGAYRFVFLQMAWVLIGMIGFWFFYKLDYHKIPGLSRYLFFPAVGFLILLAVISVLPCSWNISFAPCINGANRWIYLNPAPLPKIPGFGVLGFQPSEFAKLALVVFLSSVLAKFSRNDKSALYVYLIITGIVSGLIFFQPNMSTAFLLFLMGTSIYFASGFDMKPLFVLAPIVILLGILFIFLSPYRRERLATFLRPDAGEVVDSDYHSKQILIALGSGGFWGVGFGQSRQKYQYLPEVSADSIFAIIGEELGFVGTGFVIFLFGFLFYKGYIVTARAPDLLGKLLAVGVISWIGLQFFVNIAAMVKLIPLTGVPIPLISYGGSSLVFSLMGLGILANVSSQV